MGSPMVIQSSIVITVLRSVFVNQTGWLFARHMLAICKEESERNLHQVISKQCHYWPKNATTKWIPQNKVNIKTQMVLLSVGWYPATVAILFCKINLNSHCVLGFSPDRLRQNTSSLHPSRQWKTTCKVTYTNRVSLTRICATLTMVLLRKSASATSTKSYVW